mgnify:CR=1 FL=1
MKVILLGYMASGKSLIGKKLAELLNYNFIDLDDCIASEEDMSIKEIFKNKGEIYFRNREHEILKDLVSIDQKCVISLGGGTPCYSHNLELLLNDSDLKTIYLKVSIKNLSDRLFKERENRPLVSHLKTKEALFEFIGKHLFERLVFYDQAKITIDANKSENEIIESILLQLF